MIDKNKLPKDVYDRIETLPNNIKKGYVVYKNGFITEVHCKCCGTLIMGLIEHEKPVEVVKKNTRTIITKLMYLAALDQYTELEISFDDGSKHITPVCKKCADEMDLSNLENLYIGDLYQWAEDENKKHASKQNWDVVSKRKPKNFKLRG